MRWRTAAHRAVLFYHSPAVGPAGAAHRGHVGLRRKCHHFARLPKAVQIQLKVDWRLLARHVALMLGAGPPEMGLDLGMLLEPMGAFKVLIWVW